MNETRTSDRQGRRRQGDGQFSHTTGGPASQTPGAAAHDWNVATGAGWVTRVRQPLKLFTASSSDSYVSNTVSSFVIASRSVMRLVRLTSLSLPP